VAEPPVKLDADLQTILRKALRKEPESRYASAAHFADDLRNFLAGRPVTARQGSWRYRVWRFAKRNRLAVAMVGSIVIALLAGVAGVLWQGIRAQTSRRIAESRFHDALNLTSSLFSDFYQAVQKLDHSESAQQSLVRWSRDTLDQLAQQIGGNAILQNDVAESYLGNASRVSDLMALLDDFEARFPIVEP
jgi:eukaryotic-like serine/threonine-protein kinase